MKWSYSRAGVDLDLHKEMHKIALDISRKVNMEIGIETKGLGGYAATINIGGADLSIHIDGVGTKSILASRFNKYEIIGWDCVTANINDVACEGLKPVALGVYISVDKPNINAYRRVMEGVAKASIENGIAVLGGETAILPDLVNGIDVSCSIIAIRKKSVNNRAEHGDLLIGLPSTGLHVNGYSLARKIIETTVGYGYKVSGDTPLWEELLKPSANYSKAILEAYGLDLLHGVAHITGGGFRKLKRILGGELDAFIEAPKPPKIFRLLMELGRVEPREMYQVFNMGIGIVASIPEKNIDEFTYIAGKHGFKPVYIGEVRKGSGKIHIDTWMGESIDL